MLRSLRPVLRRLAKNPTFTVVAVLTLALGIGANAAIFSVVHGVLLQPLPYPQAERLVAVSHDAPGLDLYDFDSSEAAFQTYRQLGRSIEEIGLVREDSYNLTGLERPDRLDGGEVTPSFFATLGVQPELGPGMTDADGLPDAEPVVVVSHGFWATRMGSDPQAIGRTLRLDGVERRVVGVMPPVLDMPRPETDVWVPLVFDPAKPSDGNFNHRAVARLSPGATPQAAQKELSSLLPRMVEMFSDDISLQMLENAQLTTLVTPLQEELVGDVDGVLWILLGTVGLILLIACANVANLFLVRAEGRQREMAVRSALGAGRGDLARGFLAESLALGLAGGAVGLALAAAGVRALVAFGPDAIPRLHAVSISPPVLAFTLALSVFAGLLFGAVPMLRFGGRFSLTGALKEGGRGSSGGRERHLARNGLVVAQVALALVLLAGSGLMVRTFWELRSVDPGFDPSAVLSLRVSLNDQDYADEQAVADFYLRLQRRVAALPGVARVGAGTGLPLEGLRSASGHAFEDFPIDPGEVPPILANIRVTPGYFETLGIPLLAGRTFEVADVEEARPAVVVTQALARRFWPGLPLSEVLGKRLQLGIGTEENHNQRWQQIVGVVGDLRYDGLEEEAPAMVFYPNGPLEGRGWVARSLNLAVKSAGPEPLALAKSVREAVWAEDPNLPISGVDTAAGLVRESMARTAFTMVLLLIAAGVALLLGSVGLYGVISYLVSLRTREIGVRLALGADPGDVSRMVVGQGMAVAGLGVVLGLVAAVAVTRLMATILFGVSPTDPPTFGTVVAALLVVAALASWVPARRAAAVAPLEALRHE